MIRQLLSFALNQRAATLVLVAAVAAAGIWSWIGLQKEAYPDVGDTQVTVITQFPGRAATEVEQQITEPLERALNSVPRVLTRRSKTIFGLSVIQLTFEDGTDDYFARQRVLEKLGDAVLPDGVEPGDRTPDGAGGGDIPLRHPVDRRVHPHGAPGRSRTGSSYRNSSRSRGRRRHQFRRARQAVPRHHVARNSCGTV